VTYFQNTQKDDGFDLDMKKSQKKTKRRIQKLLYLLLRKKLV